MFMIRPVEFQGVVQRNQDMATVNQNEHNRPYIQNGNAMAEVKKDVETKLKNVNQKEDAQNQGKNPDAKEKGNNEYFGDGGRNRRSGKNVEGKVIIKERKSFDMKA